MRLLTVTAALLCLTAVANGNSVVNEFTEAGQSVEQQLASMQRMLSAVTNQLMMQQYMLEERTRASGKTGVKTVRLRKMGTRSYHSDSHTSFGSLSIHDHSNNIRTIGMGEFTAILNGIEFQTRHNDYRLYMPHLTNMSYGMVEEVPFPEVPPSVKNENNLTKAIIELQEYFRAWRDQNTTIRDYKPYFKPVLCYLEGSWTNSGEEIEEPFFSDRHFIDAKSWMELQQKSRFVSYSGSKSRFENLANLPTAVINMINGSIPEFAQFNYRILCHPLKTEVPLKAFRVADDLHLRVKNKKNVFWHERSRSARFEFSANFEKFEDGRFNYGFLDKLMGEIPGKNNHPGHLVDDGLDMPALQFDGDSQMDASRYHRVYKIGGRDATGISIVNRGYNDDYMFAAMTNHTKVSAMEVKKKPCWWSSALRRMECTTLRQRWTWAFPLEIIYLTPLQSWNPYNLEYKGDSNSDAGKSITADGTRNGNCEDGKAFEGLNSKNYYMTPVEFFGSRHTGSSADTVRGLVCVEDRNGVVRKVRASGIRAFVPTIHGVGSLRTRYPIFPVHEEGTTVWKELEALKELVMDNETYGKYSWKASNEDESSDLRLEIGDSHKSDVTKHRHRFSLTVSQQTSLKYGAEVKVITDTAAGHEHTLTLRYDGNKDKIYGRKCDGIDWKCWDLHYIYNLLPVVADAPTA